MSRTYKIAVYALLSIIILAGTVFATPAKIGRLGLSKESNYTVLTIEADKHVQVAHQSVEIKEGKPFRIVIDCIASRHSLSQKSFEDIPTSIISSIRTSQYAVNPEEVVRIVLDLKAEAIYRVESKDNNVRILISDAGTKSFSQWSTPRATGFVAKAEPKEKKASPVKIAKKADAKVKSVDKPKKQIARINTPVKQEKLQAKTNIKAKTNEQKSDSPIDKKPIPLQEKLGLAKVNKTKSANNSPVIKKAKSKPAVNKANTIAETPKKAKVSSSKVAAITPQPQKKAKSKKSSVETAKIKTATKNTKLNAQVLKSDTVNRALAFAPQKNSVPTPGDAPKSKESKNKDVHKKSTGKTETPKKQNKNVSVKSAATKTVEQPKAVVAKKQQKTEKPKTNLVKTKKADNKPVLASLETGKSASVKSKPVVAKQDDKAKNKKDRSRFRRNAAMSTKYKQTQVVQFPQRMVIKYKGATTRDPFATLIDVTKRNLGPADLSKAPNIETLNLVGIIESTPDGKDAALLEDLDGIGYILKTGDRIKNGYVGRINKRAVYFQLNEYGWSRTVVKQMEKEK